MPVFIRFYLPVTSAYAKMKKVQAENDADEIRRKLTKVFTCVRISKKVANMKWLAPHPRSELLRWEYTKIMSEEQDRFHNASPLQVIRTLIL